MTPPPPPPPAHSQPPLPARKVALPLRSGSRVDEERRIEYWGSVIFAISTLDGMMHFVASWHFVLVLRTCSSSHTAFPRLPRWKFQFFCRHVLFACVRVWHFLETPRYKKYVLYAIVELWRALRWRLKTWTQSISVNVPV